MPRINSRSKGARGEKKACQVLAKWTGDKFHRVPASGGLHWKNTFTAGDVVCDNDLRRFDFSVEVKNYADINFEHLLMPDVQCDILKYWKQCKTDANRGKKIPLLMMRYDGMKKDLFIIVIRYIDFKEFKMDLMKYPYFKFKGLIFMNSNALFKSNYKEIKKITRQIIKQTWK